MAEAPLLPVVHAVAGKAADVLVERVTRKWCIDGDRDKLERRLLAVQSVLADAEVKSKTNPTVKRWMKDLRAVACTTNGILDKLQYEALRQEAQSHWSKTSKVLSSFTLHNPVVFCHKEASRELKNVLGKIDELVSEMKNFGLVERAEVPQVTHSPLEESAEILGRDNDKEKVVKLLLDQQGQRKVQVLPITGIGGVGKTTLAKMVYNDCRVQEHFELKMWHRMSENFEAIAIVRSVIELATNRRCDRSNNIEGLQEKLQEVIGQRRFLLVLDDVWIEVRTSTWEDNLKEVLCSSIGGSGSMIVVTSRSPQVASIMGTLYTSHSFFSAWHHKTQEPIFIETRALSGEDSWELFSKKAFSKGVQENEKLLKIGKRIVEKCNGLPLALKTMGGSMSSRQVHEWESIAGSNMGDPNGGKCEVLSKLKVSYRLLTPEMKQCFALCAIFPKDYEMEKDKLIQLWMTNGFIREEGEMNLAQKGEHIFIELVWRSFLQDVEVKTVTFRNGMTYAITQCKMHGLMHDLAKDVTASREEWNHQISNKDTSPTPPKPTGNPKHPPTPPKPTGDPSPTPIIQWIPTKPQDGPHIHHQREQPGPARTPPSELPATR